MINVYFLVGVIVGLGFHLTFTYWGRAAFDRCLETYMSANPDLEWVRQYNEHLALIKLRENVKSRFIAHIARIKHSEDVTK